MNKIISIAVGITLLLFSQAGCKSTKTTIPNNTAIKCFIVGEGGGFAGSYIQYKICSNGVLSMYNFDSKEYHEIGTADPKKLDDIFTQLNELKLDELEISSPGNMSQYITILEDNKPDHTLTWALNSTGISPEIISFFHESFTYCNSFEIP